MDTHCIMVFSSMYILLDLYVRSAFPVPMACLSPFGTHRGLLLYVFCRKIKEDGRNVTLFSVVTSFG